MSFSRDVKNEILAKDINEDCCCLAFLSGLFSSSANIEIGQEVNLTLNTDLENLAPFVNKIVQKMYGKQAQVEICKSYQIKKEDYYRLTFEPSLACQMLLDTGCLAIKNESLTRRYKVDKYFLKEDHCLKHFVQGVFVGCGTSSIKIDKKDRLSTGYHMEFASKNEQFLEGLKEVLQEFDIFPRIVKRKNLYILYVKDANQVSNILALMSAYNSVFSLQNEIAVREVRNKVNRQTNCMSANINKTVEASVRQNDAISFIVSKIGLEQLPQPLQDVALLRMANPEESLDELVRLASFPITKSALNYRLTKLIKIADKENHQK